MLLALVVLATQAMRLPTKLVFEPPSPNAQVAHKHLIIGTRDLLLSDAAMALLPAGLPRPRWKYLVSLAAEQAQASAEGASANWMFSGADRKPSTIVVAVLPDACSRHASPVRPHAIFSHVKASVSASTDVLVMLEDESYAGGTACAIGRALPLFTAKTARQPRQSRQSAVAQAAAEVEADGDAGAGANAEAEAEGGTAATDEPPTVRVGFATSAGAVTNHCRSFSIAAEAVRRAARLVDLPPDRLTTAAFVEEARQVAKRLQTTMAQRERGGNVGCSVLTGAELRESGYGLLWGVGKAAESPPALVTLTHTPPAAAASEGDEPSGGAPGVCLVGKGITYDTGGLSLKGKEAMPGMKMDMGGAAALLSAFEAAVEIGLGDRPLHLVLCLAENAVGPGSLRNDDIIVGLSGLSVEVNNCDAEGRLVLADGVAHATAVPSRLLARADGGKDKGMMKLIGDFGQVTPNDQGVVTPTATGPALGMVAPTNPTAARPDPGTPPAVGLVVDMATLTGAQLVATGKRHAAVVSDCEEAERAAIAAGRLTGDMVHPLPFVPEFFLPEFASKVADMKNSVKDRSNAQASCAACFIHEHLHPSYEGAWLHVDLAGPAWLDERGTGFGVGLSLGLLEVDGFRREAVQDAEGDEV